MNSTTMGEISKFDNANIFLKDVRDEDNFCNSLINPSRPPTFVVGNFDYCEGSDGPQRHDNDFRR